MPNGIIELVAKYKRAYQDPYQGQVVPVASEFTYIVVPEASGKTSLPNNQYVDLEFDLSATPIPLWATDVSLQLVYKGQVGYEINGSFVGEEEGVAVGYLDVSEPTPIDVINNTDIVCINDVLMDAGSDTAVNATTPEGQPISEIIDIYPHQMSNTLLKFSDGLNLVGSNSTNHNARSAVISPGYYTRVFVLTNNFYVNSAVSLSTDWERTDPRDGEYHYSSRSSTGFQGLINQEYPESADGPLIRYFAGMMNIRGLNFWTGIRYEKQPYPLDSTCNQFATSKPISGPSAIELSGN